MSKTNFSLDLLRRNEQNNPEKMIGAHVPIKKSPHTVEQVVFRRFSLLKITNKLTSFLPDHYWSSILLEYVMQNHEFPSILLS